MKKRDHERVLKALLSLSKQSQPVPFSAICAAAKMPENAVFDTLDELEGLHRVSTVRDMNRGIHLVSVTDEGRSYFFVSAEERSMRRKALVHDIIVAAVSTFLGALASEPLWALLRALFTRQ